VRPRRLWKVAERWSWDGREVAGWKRERRKRSSVGRRIVGVEGVWGLLRIMLRFVAAAYRCRMADAMKPKCNAEV